MKLFSFFFFAALWALPPALAANQVLLRNVDIGDEGTALALAADKSGNLFVVASGEDAAGVSQTRIIKTNSQGTVLATYMLPVGLLPNNSLSYGVFNYASRVVALGTDTQGNVVLAGTLSSNSGLPLVKPLFPSVKPPFPSNSINPGATGGFVMKLDPQLQNIIFSTFVDGGVGALAVDAAGDIYLAGSTAAPDFPVTAGAFQTTPPQTRAGSLYTATYSFLMELAPNGDRLLYATYFGGDYTVCDRGCNVNTNDGLATAYASALAVGPSGEIAMAGATNATDLPVTSGAFDSASGASYTEYSGFVALFTTGSSPKLSWSTYAGVSGIARVTFDPLGNVIIGGTLFSQNIPATPMWEPGASSGIVEKVKSSGTALLWEISFGGSPNVDYPTGPAWVTGLALDPKGGIVITGNSAPDQLPQLVGMPILGPAYVARLSSDGSAVQEFYAAPANSVGAGLVLTSSGSFVSLGTSGSLWMEGGSSGPSLLAIANSAGSVASGQVASAELISLYGVGIGPQSGITGQAQNGAYPTSLGGYQVLFDGVPAVLLYAGPTQINAVVPSLAEEDYTHVQLSTPSGIIDGPMPAVRPAEPAIFTDGITGFMAYCAALNQDGGINSFQNPAQLGSVVSIFVSGLGSNQPVSVLAYPDPTNETGPTSLEVLYAGQAPGEVAGLGQINFRLPASILSANVFEFVVQAGSALSNPVLIVTSQ